MRGITRFAALLAFASTLGCMFRGRDGEDDSYTAKNDRGPLLARDAAGAMAGLAFSADGREVIYVAQGPGDARPVLRALPVTGGKARQLDEAHPAPGTTLAPLADGSAIYYVATVGEAPLVYGLREAISGTDVPLDPPPIPGLLLASPSGGRLVVERNDDTVLLELPSGETTPLPCGAPAVFSPAGDALLCATPAGALVRVALEGQALPDLVEIPGAARARAVSWTAQGMRAAFHPALAVGDPATGAVLAEGPSSVGWMMAFTPDGGAVVFAEGHQPWEGTEAWVMLLDLDTGEQRRIAMAGENYYGPLLGADSVLLAVSPDGARVAYTFGNHLHARGTAGAPASPSGRLP